ncbi:MAG: VTT domain-containing protein [Anaerolineae bacterium]|nr:VTT domain-containing protein [Anaerolineae bacterium]MDW8102861.1 VTT domain-containing protein [Anaerolineae bacterium]
MEKPKKNPFLSILAILLAILITVTILSFREKIQRFGAYGYGGVFVISFMGNATVLFPAPSLAVVFAMGGVLSPIIVGLVAGIGEALGELSGYLAGLGGRAIIEDYKTYERVKGWMKRFGFWLIFALSLIPNPIFDLAGITAGASGFPVLRFLLACWMGKTIKTTAVAFAGFYSISFIEKLLSR